MTTIPHQRSAHPYHMYEAIWSQPVAIARVISEEKLAVGEAASLIDKGRYIHIVGIGTSWHAALVGEHILRTLSCSINSRAWNSFEFVTAPPPLDSSDVVIVLSHRGTKSYSIEALKLARLHGCSVILVTGIGSKARTDLADIVIRTCPEEISSAFTVSHSAALTVLMMISVRVANGKTKDDIGRMVGTVEDLPRLVTAALHLDSQTAEWARSVRGSTRYYFAGWGSNESTAYEAALKIKETSYVTTEGFQVEQYLHGPFVATENGTTVTFICPPGPGRDRTKDLIQTVKAVGGYTVGLISHEDQELRDLLDRAIILPDCPDLLSPVAYLIPLQLFTYWLAQEQECNPDVFRLNDSNHRAAKLNYIL
ncbi:SIS domain-containing protein [SAR202 cluster bacterium AD-804-J14_MRT_500m]|nr:SIS domain-containing protein [SAR202 cluster bacterium AD-804-J14_MRT_500m]